jgi:hypothetical protein
MKKDGIMSLFGKALAVTALGFLTIMMFGCATSNLVDVWHDPSFKSPPLTKVLVIAIRKDATKRRIWEDAFTDELAKHGVAATSSYSLFPDAPPDSNQAKTTIQANGFDGIVVVLRLPRETNKQYVEGYSTTAQLLHYSVYWQRYITYYQEIDHPGYIDSETVGIHTIDVTTTGNDGRLVWSATSRTPGPGTVTDVQRGVAGLVISELTKRGIINRKK